jgi:protein TonB
MIAKLATAVPTGAAVTFGLLFVMQALITMQSDAPPIVSRPIPMDWRHVDIPEDLVIDEFNPDNLPEPEQTPQQRQPQEVFDYGGGIPIAHTYTLPRDPEKQLNNPFTHDGPLMAIVRVKPTYPPVAAARGLEGHVLVQFDVLSNGTVSNISVVESSHALFERAAIAAARSFRFKARVVDGVPLLSTGVQYQFRFELEH